MTGQEETESAVTRNLGVYLGERAPMTGRAKAYLWITCLRTVPIALSAWTHPDYYRTPSFKYIVGVMPMSAWGVVLTVSAVLAAVAAVLQREWLARLALICSASLAMCWVIGFMVAYHQGQLLTPVGIMWGLGIACKDLVVCRQPLWSPFEPLVQRFVGVERRKRTRVA